MKTPEVVKRTRNYIVVKIYLPDESAGQTHLAKKKVKTKAIKQGFQSYKNRIRT